MFHEAVGVVVTKIIDKTPSVFSAEVRDVIHGKLWCLYDRTGYACLRMDVKEGDTLLVTAKARGQNRARYLSGLPVLQAYEVQRRTA